MFLPKLVSGDQTGLIRDRFIGENIRLIDSVIKYTKAKNMPRLLLFPDFEKAFDTLQWPFTICQKNEIRSITVKNKEIKLSQYADDTTLILDGSEESFLESLKIIGYFGNISGLKLNSKKTEALWIGASGEWHFKLCPQKDFKRPKKKTQSIRGMAVNGPRFNYNFELQR